MKSFNIMGVHWEKLKNFSSLKKFTSVHWKTRFLGGLIKKQYTGEIASKRELWQFADLIGKGLGEKEGEVEGWYFNAHYKVCPYS